ncbi:MAG: hypothetical protein ISS28_07425 [Candidatus Cloacimonetes bacterium]|nr:hypothetical protein [Candidatus Cloacimonadota bacterium]
MSCLIKQDKIIIDREIEILFVRFVHILLIEQDYEIIGCIINVVVR